MKILYIGGSGRCGSTLFGYALGSIPNVGFVGEMTHFWDFGIQQNVPLGNGVKFLEDKIWSAVCEEVFGSYQYALEASTRMKRIFDKKLRLPRLIMSNFSPSGEEIVWMQKTLVEIFSAYKRLTGVEVIVDGSKHAGLLSLIANTDEIDLYHIWMVRNPYDVVYSWKHRQKSYANGKKMKRWGLFRSALAWQLHNFSLDRVSSKYGVPTKVLRYEDLLQSPRDTVYDVLSLIGISPEDSTFIDDRSFMMPHSINDIAGNPEKSKVGKVTITQSSRGELTATERFVVSLVANRYVHKFGYT